MTNAEHLRAARARARREGKCIVCRKREAKPGCSSCVECIDASCRKADVRAEAGKCRSCGRAPRPERKTCAACAARNARNLRKSRDARRAKGLCQRGACATRARSGRVTCEDHKGTCWGGAIEPKRSTR
jgi:hypothetical protein